LHFLFSPFFNLFFILLIQFIFNFSFAFDSFFVFASVRIWIWIWICICIFVSIFKTGSTSISRLISFLIVFFPKFLSLFRFWRRQLRSRLVLRLNWRWWFLRVAKGLSENIWEIGKFEKKRRIIRKAKEERRKKKPS
jgi:hypothetical protein